jgi:cytochrome c biogenesis protein CcdA
MAYLIESKSLDRGILAGLVFTSGLVTVLSIMGALLSFVGGVLIAFLPWLQLVVAAAIMLLGLIQIIQLNLPSFAPRMRVKKGIVGLYLFGLGFGLVISGCTAPIFFSIILYSFISGFQNGILTLAAYGLGMGLVTMVVSIITVQTKQSMLNQIARYSSWINRITGFVLIAAGLYILNSALALLL